MKVIATFREVIFRFKAKMPMRLGELSYKSRITYRSEFQSSLNGELSQKRSIRALRVK